MDLTSIVVGAGPVAALWAVTAWRRRRHPFVIKQTVTVPVEPKCVHLVADIDDRGEPVPPAWQNQLTALHQHARREAVPA